MSVKKIGGLMPYGSKQATALAAKVGNSHDAGGPDIDQAGASAIAMVLVDKKDLGGRRVVRLTH